MLKKIIFSTKTKPVNQANSNSSNYQKQLFVTYGTVSTNNEDGTCNVLLKNGFTVRVRIPSSVWSSSDPITGGITYPPINSECMIYHPDKDLGSGFVYPVNINTRNTDIESALLGQGDKKILPGGWEFTYNQETGKATFKNGETFLLDVNPDEGADNAFCSLTDFNGNSLLMNKDGVLINGNLEILI